MPRKPKYKVGEIYNNRELIAYERPYYTIKCLKCGKVTKTQAVPIANNCICSKLIKRCSGLAYELPKGRIEELKEKYKNGVTREHIEAIFYKRS